MAPIRIAEVVRPATGGIRHHVSDLLEHLDRRRFLPTLFAPEDFIPDRPIPNLARHNVEIRAGTHLLWDYRTVGKLAQLLRRNIDIVHAHGLRGAVVGGFAARRAGLPYLFTVHNLLPDLNFVQSLAFREMARKANRVIAVSAAVATTLQAMGLSAQQIAVIPNGVDLTRFEGRTEPGRTRAILGIKAGERMLLGVGRLAPEKGFDVLIEAFTSMHPRLPDVRLVIAGEGPEAPQLKVLAEATGNRVLFVGHMPDTVPLFEAADIVVAPSRQEGQGIVPLEAMAAGRPVIASRVGGLVETIVEGRTGLLVPSDDVHALAEALKNLLQDAERRAEMGAAGRHRVRQEYSLQTQLQKIEAIYSDVFERTA
jgi:glycosyltransferase involved in cell wall biosynthesis